MRLLVAAAAFVGFFLTWRSFVIGADAETGKIRRDERPLLYWSYMAAMSAAVGAFSYFAAFGEFS
jgi:hypothetical protein